MGLAEPKRRKKLSYDPNNTAWTRSDGFGRKILSSQGWSPGNYLGAKDAEHAGHFSKASASGVSIKLKDNNFGVGVKSQALPSASYNSLLSAYDNILGKLNGKTDAELGIEKEEKAAIGRRMYTMQRYGTTHFVRGGYLVGDRIEKTKPHMLGDGCSEKNGSEHRPSDRTQGAERLRAKEAQSDAQIEETIKAQRRANRKAKKRSRDEDDPTVNHAEILSSEERGALANKAQKENQSDRRRRKEEKRKQREESRRRKEAKASKSGN
ncbi:MAG: telomerase inhibitor [Alyxoria varia]|nr:MAG: telomerase inhibitor [Alyxoria varia]